MPPPALRSLLPHIGAQLTDLCSVATSDLPVMGATLGMMTHSFRMRMEHVVCEWNMRALLCHSVVGNALSCAKIVSTLGLYR
jgi:hypothetical protein